MLFTYKYINHEIEKFQHFSDFLFIDVWCNAKGEFNSKKLRGNRELQMIYEEFHYDDGKSATFFNSHIELIYAEFLNINKTSREKLKSWYKINNRISFIYRKNIKSPISYDQLSKKHPELTKLLKSFYFKLYGNDSPFILKAFGNLKEIKKSHYKNFIDKNFNGHEGICPFCGLSSIKGNDHSKLEAYDHFISKGNYPFNSINFKNLAPMCHECNSSYKLEKEPLFNIDSIVKTNKIKRKAFYPYEKKTWNIEVDITLNNNISQIKVEDIDLNIKTTFRQEELESWKEVYSIEERYKAKIVAEHYGLHWYKKIEEGFNNAKKKMNPHLTKEEWYDFNINECNISEIADLNFIKKPFLEECKRKALFK
ncbi:hypothetical protein [uncultured Chryseobacterium sp.]|uniref:hypothetical protein n=1 Tax=uncultured Chryseobacterium sp. TaxID=259322 RepID=UPI0025DB7920|nr:hypothetical protein [uncultured Chryseobacterium sp.]